MAMATEEKLLLTVSEVAERLNLHRSYVYSGLIAPGILRSVHIGRRRLVAARDLAAYVEKLMAEQGEGDTPPTA